MLSLLTLCPVRAEKQQAVIFIDSSDPAQTNLITEINQSLFYSPTLRRQVAVQVFDINPRGPAFSGELDFQRDGKGQAVGQFRPGKLPYLFCRNDGETTTQFTLRNKDQLCLCIKKY
ncbi:hypothetical protein ACUTQ5_08555 [Serratia sp. NA_112.1]|uniref:hypothetical protein n=1 Tax=unclassified Serratia (in: enterobacteria) TaxID=2647522 RepID=UPI004046E5C4